MFSFCWGRVLIFLAIHSLLWASLASSRSCSCGLDVCRGRLPLQGRISLWLNVLLVLVVPLSTGRALFYLRGTAAGRPSLVAARPTAVRGYSLSWGLLSTSKQTANNLHRRRPFYQFVWQFDGEFDGCACDVRIQLPTAGFLIELWEA